MSLSLPKPEKRVRTPKPLRRSPAPKRARRPRRQRKSSLAALKRKLWPMFAAYVKARDGNVCFSCGAEGLEGRNWQAGHMYSKKAHPALYYHPLAVHSQCYRCNKWLGGNGAAYASHFLEVYGVDQLLYIDSVKNKEPHFREHDYEALIEALVRGGADYELKYIELSGHAYTPAGIREG